jgi:hypothetical protein
MGKYAIVLLAVPSDLGRAAHGLLYTKDLHEAGHEVQLIFDGAGTTWVKAFSQSDHKYHALYQEIKGAGLIGGACEYCAQAFQVSDAVEAEGVPFVGEFGGHPSVARLIAEGYALITL